ncbi:MAG: anti-sigma-factor antagonist [Ferruginibacter sp.]|nr:anti-sigma-factor antagonist [Ferruginibacter sp.]
MNVKIDTKEKFIVFAPLTGELTANMTEELINMLLSYLQKDIPHIVLNMSVVSNIDQKSCEMIANVQQEFYEKNCSFVICELQKDVEMRLDEMELLELLNVTPTQSEAWDIVQMEEIERELLGDED